jgi:hypothetical protein
MITGEQVRAAIERLDVSIADDVAAVYGPAREAALRLADDRPREAWEHVLYAERLAHVSAEPEHERATVALTAPGGGVGGWFTEHGPEELGTYMNELDGRIQQVNADQHNPERTTKAGALGGQFSIDWTTFLMGAEIPGVSGWHWYFNEKAFWFNRYLSDDDGETIWQATLRYDARFVELYEQFVAAGGKPTEGHPTVGPEHPSTEPFGADDLRAAGRGALWIGGAVAAVWLISKFWPAHGGA